jgi:hypothetical protein
MDSCGKMEPRFCGATLTAKPNGGGHLVKEAADMAALARLIRYSEEEAQRLGVSGVVVECLRMANIELTNAITNGGAGGSADDAEAVRMN